MTPISIPGFDITNEGQILGLSFATEQHNQQLLAQLPEEARESFVPRTRGEYLQETIEKILNGWAAAESEHVYAQAKAAYEGKSTEGKAAILGALGINRNYGE